MDLVLATPARRTGIRTLSDRQLLLALALVAVLVRVPLLRAPLGIDEGGYALVASQWTSAGGSLYGGQWVDRPPLLLGLFAAAIAVAGDLGIRLLGCIAAFVTVWACGQAAHRVGGRSAMFWAAVTAAALVSNTAIQGQIVNAEVPAIAFTALSIWCCIEALCARHDRHVRWWSYSAGASAAAAVLVKQSHVDALVFACAALAWAVVRRPTGDALHARRVLLRGFAGFVSVVLLAAAAVELAGPGVQPMVDAVFGFRVDARSVIEASPGAPDRRALLLLGAAVVSGMLALLVVTSVGLMRLGRAPVRKTPEAPAIAVGLVAALSFGVFAVVEGGNWWPHYLLQLVPTLAIASGLVIAVADKARRRVIIGVATAAVVATCVLSAASILGTLWWSATHGLRRPSHVAADWLRTASEPGETGLVVWGHPDILRRSGLGASYELSWSLPIRVRDPKLRELRGVMAGTNAPDWVVAWNGFNTWSLDADGQLAALVKRRYERLGELCGHPVYRLRSTGSSTEAVPPLPTTLDCGVEPTFFGTRLT